MTNKSARRALWMLAAGAAMLSMAACSRRAGQQPEIGTRPAGEPQAATRPAPGESPAAGPTTAPATRPREELPASTFDTEPPYTVQLYVRKPEDRQPGWLKILELQDDQTAARARGVFPRQNVMEITTQNVRRIRVELGYLPLAEGKRVVLRINDQGIEITQRDRRFVTLELRPTGRWEVEKTPEE